MNRSGNGNGTRRMYLLLFAVMVVVVVWHNRSREQGRASWPEDAVTLAARPTQTIFARAVSRLSEGWALLGEIRRLHQENQRLKALLAEKETQIESLKEAHFEVERLRRLVSLKGQMPGRVLAAEVIGHSPSNWKQTLILNVGRRQGVVVDSLVTAYASETSAGALVGHVYQVASYTAQVLLITDTKSGVGAMVQAERRRAVGVCKGNGQGGCTFQYLRKDADVRVGDTIVTSGQGKVFPTKGIVIGRVTSVTRHDYDSSLEAEVKPYVDFERLEEVLVLWPERPDEEKDQDQP